MSGVSVSVRVSDEGAQQFVVNLGREMDDRGRLNRALAERLKEVLQDHFRLKNRVPNKLGGPRTNFWSGVAEETAVGEVTGRRAEVVVGAAEGQSIRVHLFGGTIEAKKASALTIPLIPAAHGKRVSEYEQTKGELFRPRGTNILAEKAEADEDSNALVAVYALVKSVTIPRDPETLPADEELTEELVEEVEDFLRRADQKGGLA